MYSNISDCDEGTWSGKFIVIRTQSKQVYNFWEPLHYLDRGYGFQTWEVAPQFAIRSWAYISLFLHPVTDVARFLRLDKVCLLPPTANLSIDQNPRGLLSLGFVFFSQLSLLYARRNSIVRSWTMLITAWVDTCSSVFSSAPGCGMLLLVSLQNLSDAKH